MSDTKLICKAIAIDPDHATNNKFRFESVEITADTLDEQIEEDKQFGVFPIPQTGKLTYRLVNHSSDFDKKNKNRIGMNYALTQWDVEIKPDLKYLSMEQSSDISIEPWYTNNFYFILIAEDPLVKPDLLPNYVLRMTHQLAL